MKQRPPAARRPRQFWPVRAFDIVASASPRLGMRLDWLDEERLLEKARRKCRLDDFGNEEFRLPLRLLLEDLRHDPTLGGMGRIMMRQVLLDGLCNRLRIEEAIARQPEIESTPLPRPLFVVAPPRTGTTLLYNLLALDPAGRAPQKWELDSPWPLADLPEGSVDPRIEKAQRGLDFAARVAPGLKAIHHFRADAPEECHALFRNSMATWFREFSDVPGYTRWKLGSDMRTPYREYRRQLQLLFRQRPAGYPILKFPGHAWHLDALLEHFPDARLVFTHREPSQAIGSFCSMISEMRRAFHTPFDPIALGALLLEEVETGLQRMLEVRERLSSSQFIDVAYPELIADPWRTVVGIHDHFGAPPTDGMEAAIKSWLDGNRQHRHGVHSYDLADFGLSQAQIAERLSFYTSRFCDG